MKKFVYTTLVVMLSLQTAVGGTWMKNKTKSGASFGKVCALVDRGGSGYCLVQENGTISWSDDGSSWATGTDFAQGTLRCADFFDNNNGVAAGLNLLEYTKDGGKNWTVIQGNTVPFDVRGVCMTSPNTVVLVGSGGNIAEYTFGQSSVTAKTSGTRNTLNSVSFYGGTGYACGDDGTILKYEDGAWTCLTSENEKNWVSYTDPTEAGRTVRLNEIRAVDARTVYACGDEGVLLKTVDGGTTWSRRESGTTQNLTAMTIKPDGNLSINGGGKQLTVDDQTDKYSVKMYYDRLGRVVASQNSKQHAMRPQRFSYTVYDALGRNVEAGELESDAEPTEAMINATDTRFPDNWSHKRYQVIRSVYDEPIYGESADDSVRQAFGEGGQQHLRNRIATTLYQEEYNPSSRVYNHATHYSYDIHGNVSTLVHDIRELGKVGQRFKRIDYDYDLVSGKVNRLDYQKGQPDGYSLRYDYDGENRLTKVLANYGDMDNEDQPAWHELARYEYYRHGPLARTVLGTNLQGVDYAYTLQGWTKGVNLSQESDTVKADVYGYELQYNNEDYKPIGIANHPQVDDGAANLYNGNIAAMRTTLTQNVPANEGNLFGAQTRRFVYDELNRLKASQVIGGDQYATSYVYDANGNITSLSRNDQSGAAMDNLTYHYAMDKAGNILNNRLLHVNDAANTTDGTDIKDQGGNYTQQRASTHNYAYDEMGNLIKDKSEQIAEIKWTVTGKVSDVIRTAGSQKPDLHFDYDAMGQRIAKTVTNKNVTTGDKFVTTYYVRDPQGNVLAVYEHKHGESGNGTFTLAEQHLYGAGRLGMRKRDLALNATNTSETPATYYELTNHLGNVMAVISDEASDTNEPTVVSLSDYYPFGMTEPGRSWNPGDYRFGYTGHEKESDLAEGVYITEYRLLDTRLGRWMSVDPRWMEEAYLTPYHYCRNIPLYYWDEKGNVETETINGKKRTKFNPTGGTIEHNFHVELTNTDRGNKEYYVFEGKFYLDKGEIFPDNIDNIDPKPTTPASRMTKAVVRYEKKTVTTSNGRILPTSSYENRGYEDENTGKTENIYTIYENGEITEDFINNDIIKGVIEALKANCHGLAYTAGDVWIEDKDALSLVNIEYENSIEPVKGGKAVNIQKDDNGNEYAKHSITIDQVVLNRDGGSLHYQISVYTHKIKEEPKKQVRENPAKEKGTNYQYYKKKGK